jgi:TPR repeat protein
MAGPVFVSEELGFSLLRSAADLGHADAQFLCGQCLAAGRGCAVDRDAVDAYIGRAEDGGNSFALAAREVNMIGMGDDANQREGFECLRRSADGGNAFAQAMCGIYMMDGKAGVQDVPRAVDYLKRAAHQGNSAGQGGFGAALLAGKGIEADPPRGAALFKKAADQGLDHAQAAYAGVLEKGIGVAQDLREAAHYFKLAYRQGLETARDGFERCSRAREGGRSIWWRSAH